MLVADSLGRCESCLCDGVYLLSLQRLSHQECAPPNMRLKLAGLSFLKEAECCALAGTDCRPLHLAPAGGSPAA